MKSHTWSKDDGSEWDISDIPEDMLDEANSKRQELLDVVAEADDDVLEKYFADEELTVEDIKKAIRKGTLEGMFCLLYTSPSPRDGLLSRMPSSA